MPLRCTELPGPAPAATVLRAATDTREEGEDDRTVVTEILTSHPRGGAEEPLRPSVRHAAPACAAGFRTTSEDGPDFLTETTPEVPAGLVTAQAAKLP
ncbi:hypothetical protein [Streptomyces pratensis]|uniref:hypothetical protein n=1 Tax=Streptomyces pratensis TaxID=1169025 RepID=UPI001934AD40|nr:hypothetical protein [Streptomyces pratensis]